MRGFNRKMQGTAVMHSNVNGEELEEYSSLARNFQATVLQVIWVQGPTIPKAATVYTVKSRA